MKKYLFPLALLLLAHPAQATQVSRSTFQGDLSSVVNDNTSGDVTPADERGKLQDIADSAFMLLTDTIDTILPAQSGHTGQFLKTNGTASSWATPAGTSPLTTKGDVWGFGSADTRIPAGADGQALIYDAAATNGVGTYDRGFGAMAYRSGRYYGPWVNGNFTTVTASTTVINFCPVYVFKRATFTAIGYRSTSGGNAAHFGVFTDNGGLPGTLVSGSDVSLTITTGSSQDAAFSSAITLTPGWYWLAVQPNANETMIGASSSAQNQNILGADSIGTTGASSGDRVTATHTFGAMPSTAPSPAFAGAGNGSIYLALKAQ